MRRTLVVLLVLGLVLTACGGESGGDATPSSSSDTTSPTATAGPGSTSAPDSPATPSTTTIETTDTTSDRPVAPDFTLTLGEGGTYTLSEGAKPVYLVFWAEW